MVLGLKSTAFVEAYNLNSFKVITYRTEAMNNLRKNYFFLGIRNTFTEDCTVAFLFFNFLLWEISNIYNSRAFV